MEDIIVGDWVIVDSVRTSGTLDWNNGFGWVAFDVTVQVIKITGLTFHFHFNNESHIALINEAKKTKYIPTLFDQLDKVQYAKDQPAYKRSLKYT